jgi:hypothetical protein
MSLLLVTNNAAALAASKAYRSHHPQLATAMIAPRHPSPDTGPVAKAISRIAHHVRALFTHPSK